MHFHFVFSNIRAYKEGICIKDFNKIIEQYSNYVFKICYSVTKDYFESEDIMQEVFMSVYRHRYDINEDSVKSYLARTALNKSRDYIRKNSKHTKVPLEEDIFIHQDESVMKELLNEEIMEKIALCISKLDEPYRDIAHSYYLKGENIATYTKRTGIKLKTAQTRIRRARDKLKILLRKEYGDGY